MSNSNCPVCNQDMRDFPHTGNFGYCDRCGHALPAPTGRKLRKIITRNAKGAKK